MSSRHSQRRPGDIESPDETTQRGPALREKTQKRLKKEEEQEKAAYNTLMDLLERVEERNEKVIYWIMFEIFIISGLTAAMVCTLKLERMKHNRFLDLRMWQYVMMAMVVFTGLSIIRFITTAIFWASTCLWRLHRDLAYYLKQIKATVDVTIWLCAVLFAWYVWFRPRLKHVYGEISIIAAQQITRFLIAVCLGSVLWLGKNVLFLWLEADLHYIQLCNRITRTTLQLHVLQILHNRGMWKFLTHTEDRLKIQELIDRKLKREEQEETKLVADTEKEEDGKDNADPWMKGYNICKELLWVNKETVPVLILKRLCKEYKNQIKLKPLPVTKEIIQNPEKLMDQASKLFLQMKTPKTKNQGDHPDSDDDEVKLEDLQEKYHETVKHEELELLFKRFRGKQCQYNIENSQIDNKSGLARCLRSVGRVCCCPKNDKSDEAGNATVMEDHAQDENDEWKIIGRDEFCSWAVQAYRNCWGLQNTLKSSEQIIIKLNRMMVAFVLLLALIIWLLLSQIVDSGQIALLFSPLLAAKFIFSESTKNMFDGLIFALAMHPFNPGDRVIIEGMELLVTEINILSTTFYKYQTGEELVYPNSALATTQIINLELTPDQSDKIEFPIPFLGAKESQVPNTTPLEDIRDLEIKIQMSLNERKDAFKSKVVKTEMGSANITMTAHFNYVGSYLTSEVKAVHKSDMLSMIMHLVNNMNSSKEKQAPSTCKPYIVDVTLNNKVKLKKVEEFIKPAIKRSIGKHFKDREYKTVMYNAADRRVWIAFYVWKKTSDDSNEEHELISLVDLAHIQTCIRSGIENADYQCTYGEGLYVASTSNEAIKLSSTGDGGKSADSKLGLQVKTVKIQPTPGVLEMTLLKDNLTDAQVKVIKYTIKRYLYKRYYEDDFEVEINKDDKRVEIYAWRKFSHDIEKETQLDHMGEILQQFDVKHILDKQLELHGVTPVKISEVISLKAQKR